MTLTTLVFYSITLFLMGYIVSAINEARERREREQQKRRPPVKQFNFKL